jgi:hypothetical protein
MAQKRSQSHVEKNRQAVSSKSEAASQNTGEHVMSNSSQGFQGSNFAKPRRGTGNPVSPAAEHARFIPPPPFTGVSLTLPLTAILPNIQKEAEEAGQLVFHTLGDTGGIHGTDMQEAIAAAMEAQTKSAGGNAPRFFYHLGDVVYFNGQSINYQSQFYEPYQYYNAPIFAIPGNHDGDTVVQKNDQPDNEPSLQGFMTNFCSPTPEFLFKHRQTMTQPYCYWKLEAPYTHIIGLYSNVDGLLDARGTSQQQNWFIDQIKALPDDKWFVLGVHHPCYSLDSAHGGYEETLNALDSAFQSGGRRPDVVLHGHVHNYQRFSRSYKGGSDIPFIVAGAGGYATTQQSLHKLQKGLQNIRLPYQTTVEDVTLQYVDVENSGFLRVTAASNTLEIDYYSVSFANPPVISSGPADSIKISAGAKKRTP